MKNFLLARCGPLRDALRPAFAGKARHPARSRCRENEKERARNRLTGIRTRGSPKPKGLATVIWDIRVFVSRRCTPRRGGPLVLVKAIAGARSAPQACTGAASSNHKPALFFQVIVCSMAFLPAAQPGLARRFSDEGTKQRFAKAGTTVDHRGHQMALRAVSVIEVFTTGARD